MRKTLLLSLFACMLAVAPARAQSLTFFFNTAYLDPLAQSPLLLNLDAQSVSRTPQVDVNAFDDFYLINGPGRLKVNFDRWLQNKGQVPLPGWIGVAQFSNHDIFYDLQAGFESVKAKYNMPNARVGRVTVYKTLNTGQLVYDYAVALTPTLCQEYLFTPQTGGFQLGYRVNCYVSLRSVRRGVAGRAGRA
jgi:hypothetical protein